MEYSKWLINNIGASSYLMRSLDKLEMTAIGGEVPRIKFGMDTHCREVPRQAREHEEKNIKHLALGP